MTIAFSSVVVTGAPNDDTIEPCIGQSQSFRDNRGSNVHDITDIHLNKVETSLTTSERARDREKERVRERGDSIQRYKGRGRRLG